MSTPRTLVVPEGVEATRIETPRGSFAVHRARPEAAQRGRLLLIPGWTGSKEDFTQLLPHLAAAGFDATAYDQRGQFETPAADDDDFSLSGLAADAASIADALSERVHLLGHSFGGLVAQTATVEHTDQWASLSLLCTGPGGHGEADFARLNTMVEALDTTPMIEVCRRRTKNAKNPPEIQDFVERKYVGTSAASLRAMTLHLMHAPDRVDEVAATGLPVWVGYGEHDNAWPIPTQDAMAARLGAAPVMLPGLAHSPAVEGPEALAAAWLEFLLSR
ncbi:MAG: alpha/beta hydrolase [Aeromicrobium sp.]|uniref:alpha/beta fold hydrolase n=1 Tax=Aeromicrobium sp. TaxID=1871063 RepID=UPI0039E627B9